ncbi:MAG: RrF2 family transcriptional regulator, partial [Lachnospiraceae bacterium]
TKGQNAIKLMLDLATYSVGEPVKLKDIAKRQRISEKYLEQIIALLHKAGLVKSIRGARGGYALYYPPEKYTVGQVLRTAEGNLAPADCVGENGTPCENKATCVSYRLWEKLDTAINDVLESITLADMLDWQNELSADQYVI